MTSVPGGDSAQAELVEAVVVDPEVVGQLVNHGRADFVREIVGLREVFLQRQPEKADLVGDDREVRAPLGPRHALVQPVQGVVTFEAVLAELLRGGLVLDDDRDLPEVLPERRGNPREGAIHQPLERAAGRAAEAGGATSALGHRPRIVRPPTRPL